MADEAQLFRGASQARLARENILFSRSSPRNEARIRVPVLLRGASQAPLARENILFSRSSPRQRGTHSRASLVEGGFASPPRP